MGVLACAWLPWNVAMAVKWVAVKHRTGLEGAGFLSTGRFVGRAGNASQVGLSPGVCLNNLVLKIEKQANQTSQLKLCQDINPTVPPNVASKVLIKIKRLRNHCFLWICLLFNKELVWLTQALVCRYGEGFSLPTKSRVDFDIGWEFRKSLRVQELVSFNEC